MYGHEKRAEKMKLWDGKFSYISKLNSVVPGKEA